MGRRTGLVWFAEVAHVRASRPASARADASPPSHARTWVSRGRVAGQDLASLRLQRNARAATRAPAPPSRSTPAGTLAVHPFARWWWWFAREALYTQVCVNIDAWRKRCASSRLDDRILPTLHCSPPDGGSFVVAVTDGFVARRTGRESSRAHIWFRRAIISRGPPPMGSSRDQRVNSRRRHRRLSSRARLAAAVAREHEDVRGEEDREEAVSSGDDDGDVDDDVMSVARRTFYKVASTIGGSLRATKSTRRERADCSRHNGTTR